MFDNVRYILTIAATERKMLYRQARFWVLGALGLAGVLFFMVVSTIVSIIEDGIPGEFLLEGTDAYLALYFFSYAQAILIIFVAADFRKTEEKNRLDQVMLSRPMTTANWVVGKYLGAVSAVLIVNVFLILVATIGRIFKVILAGAGFNILPFLKYFAIAALPSVLFMTALVFFIASLIRVQAVGVVLAIGYVASILFYFRHDYYGLFDYGAFFAPLFASDFIGFGNITNVLWQRLYFVLLGLVFLGLTIIFYPRLEQSKVSHWVTRGVTIASLVGAILIGVHLVNSDTSRQAQFQADFEYQTRWIHAPQVQVDHYDLDVRFGAEPPLQVSTRLSLKNPTDKSLDSLVFTLNQGLRVEDVRIKGGDPIPFVHEHQLLELDLRKWPIEPGAAIPIEIHYAGSIDARAVMLDRLPASNGLLDKRDGPWTQPNESAWLSGDFAVLPSQCAWYPKPGAAGGYDFEVPRPRNFSTARIQIRTPARFQTISQGAIVEEKTEDDTRVTTFEVEKPVPELSLNIGEYFRLSHRFEQAEIALYVHEKHLAGYELFEEVADTCYDAIDQIFTTISDVSGMRYPYPRLSIVEVPLHMQVYTGRLGVDNILLQPGVIMLDEVTLASHRIKQEIEDNTKRARRRGRDDSPAGIKWNVFVDFATDIFFSDRLWRDDGSLRSPVRNYVNYQIDLRNPLLERAFELQLYEACERQVRDILFPDRWNESLSSYDQLRQNEGDWVLRRRYNIELDSLLDVMTKTPLSQVRPNGDGNLYRAMVDFKSAPVIEMMRRLMGERAYAQALSATIEKNRYRQVDEMKMVSGMAQFSDEDIIEFYDHWIHHATFPGYRILQARADKIDAGERKILYQITTRIQNGERGNGFVRLVCNLRDDKIHRSIELSSYEEKEVSFTVSQEPRSIEVIPFFSRNRGKIVKPISISNRVTRASPIDTSFTVSSEQDSSFFIVDDQDDGFFTPVLADARYLRPPSKGSSWWERTDDFAFGKYYLGWHAKEAGDGDYPARWETHVPLDGDYELSFYFRVEHRWYQRMKSDIFELQVTDSEGTHELSIRPEDTPDGWYPLGQFSFLREKPAVVELLDEGNGYLFADAVRWELIQ